MDSRDPVIRSYHDSVMKAREAQDSRPEWPRQAFENMPPVIHGRAKTLQETPVEIRGPECYALREITSQDVAEHRERASALAEHPVETKLEAETQAMEQKIMERNRPKPWWKRLLFWL
ncbi:hypothetical protein D3C87_1583550 [compost metagenome]